MGYFRRYKLSDATADQCRRGIGKIIHEILDGRNKLTPIELGAKLEAWACLRELLARHENANKSKLDTPD